MEPAKQDFSRGSFLRLTFMAYHEHCMSDGHF